MVGGATLAAAAKPEGKPHVYKRVGDRELKIYVTQPAGPADGLRPAIVFFHGGGWVGGAPGQFTEHATHFAQKGIVCFQVEYRLLDRKRKDPPTMCIHDAKSAMRWVRTHAGRFRLDTKRIAAAGGSAGGHLAAFVGICDGVDDPQDDAGVDSRANLLLLFNPVYDNGPGGWGVARVGKRYPQFSPMHQITKDDPPTIVFLGTKDRLVPVATGKKFRQKMVGLGIDSELHLYEDQPHGFFNTDRSGGKYYRETVAAADKFLRKHGWIESAKN